MTLEKARKLLRKQAVVDLIPELDLERIFDFKPGIRFKGA